MNIEVKALFDMFPDTPRETLSAIWENCDGNFPAAVDEALTLVSLEDTSGNDAYVEVEEQQECWEDASSFASMLNRPALNARTPTSSSEYDTGETRCPSSTTGYTPASPDSAWTPHANGNGQPRLPWECKESRYVIGSGELGLLNELQQPRRGSVVPLAGDFLRVPSRSVMSNGDSVTCEAPPDMEPLVALDDDERVGESGDCLVEPHRRGSSLLTPTHETIAWRGGAEFNGGTVPRSNNRQSRSTLDRPSPAGLADALSVTSERPSPKVSTGGNVQMQPLVGGEDDHLRVNDNTAGESIQKPTSDGRTKKVSKVMIRAPKVVKAGAGPSAVKSEGGWVSEMASPAHMVETASSAERIAAFRPGTRFRVAVDKGSTGLGITIKQIRGRFFVYRLQALADGSPGAAEEAGVRAGDQLLGVEELDFEFERWDMDQLVSYMGELMGVVILHIMRGFGPLPEAPESDLENGMSRGVARKDKGGAADGGEAEGGEESGLSMGKKRARRFVEVLQNEGLSKPSEAANISSLYCQISDRATQWDTGELWLSVANMARRPSTGALAAVANEWRPDPPAGWDESDSSDDGSSPPRQTDGKSGGFRKGSLPVVAAPNPAKIRLDSAMLNGGEDPSADLDQIGAALLGQPLFSDPRRAGGSSPASFEVGGHPEEKVHYWSPWPQLVALEGKAAQRRTIVPTRGLRKALNVRILQQSPTSAAAAAAAAAGSKKSSPGALADSRTVSYVVWVMDVESGAEWKVSRCHPEFAELWEVCTGIRPSLARLDFPPWLPDVKETPGVVEARRPRLEAYLQRLCSLLYMGPLHPSSAHLAHLLQDFLGASARVETLGRLQKSRPERELRQALQVRTWQVMRLPPLERAVATFVGDICNASGSSRSKKAMAAEVILKRLTEVIEHLQYVVTEGCFDELREMVRSSAASTKAAGRPSAPAAAASSVGAGRRGEGSEGMRGGDDDEGEGPAHSELKRLAEEDEALELISGSVRRQVEAEVFVPVMARLYKLLRAEGPTARLEKAVALGVDEARGKPQSFHGIPITNISPSSWNSSVKLLQTVGLFTLPCDKLEALMAVAHEIPALHRFEHPSDSTNGLGADDFLPIFIYVLVNSGVEDLAAQSLILETLCDPKKMMGEAGFCVATLSAALQHLGRLAEDRISKGAFSNFLGRRSQLF